jgi:hypothetical protein
MRTIILMAFAAVATCGCSNQTAPTTPAAGSKSSPPAAKSIAELTPAEAKGLIPEAASMAASDFEMLATSPDADPTKIGSQTLSWLLLSANPFAMKGKPEALDEFRFLGEMIQTVRIVEVMSKSKSKGYVTLLQPEFITDCQCRTENDVATGTVAFQAAGLYAGQIEFVARPDNGKWRIEEFHLPGYGQKTVRGADGRWQKSDLPAKDK